MAKKAGVTELSVWYRVESGRGTHLRGTGRDLVAYECLANAPLFAKPDIEKSFVLWEVPGDMKGLEIVAGEGVESEHAALYKLFVTGKVVRFPFNLADSQYGGGKSLSWSDTFYSTGGKLASVFYRLPRWSTASRSNFALVPETIDALESLDTGALTSLMKAESADDNRFQIPQVGVGNDAFVHVAEWNKLYEALGKPFLHGRFFKRVKDPGEAAQSGVVIGKTRYRLYSIKTGISYVGSKDELGAHKNRLESNSALAMLRSDVMRTLPNKDPGFGLQTEILTITAPALDEDDKLTQRDGFQVRDLSCMRPGLSFLPAQAIPYVRHDFEPGMTSPEVLVIQRKLRSALTEKSSPELSSALRTKELDAGKVRESETDRQVEYWYRSFTYPLGRAKARLFLNYGLIHTSANAQNFVLGFKGGMLEQFMVRDVGDTSWHDDYIEAHAGGTIVDKAFGREGESKAYHMLRDTSSDDYPAPYIVRLAAWSLLTHDFGKNMGWNDLRLYQFISGIFDGFLDFIAACFGIEETSGLEGLAGLDASKSKLEKQPTVDEDIKTLGKHCRYTFSEPKKHNAAYTKHIDECLKSTASQLLARAGAVREVALETLSPNQTKYEFQSLVAAEETLVCAAVERLLFKDQSLEEMKKFREAIKERIVGGLWPPILV